MAMITNPNFLIPKKLQPEVAKDRSLIFQTMNTVGKISKV